MKLTETLRSIFAPKTEQRSTKNVFDEAVARVLADAARGGVPVCMTREQAMLNATVYRSVRLIIDAIATLPVSVINAETKAKVPEHPASLVLVRPNGRDSRSEFLSSFLENFLVYGSGFAEISVKGLNASGLVVRPSDNVTIESKNGTNWYTFQVIINGVAQTLTISEAKLMRMEVGGSNISPVDAAIAAIRVAHIAELMALDHLKDGARPDIAITLPPEKVLEQLANKTKDGVSALDTAHKSIQSQIAGARTSRELYLPFGYNMQAYPANLQQAQFNETREFQTLEIARAFGIPPSKLSIGAAPTEADNLAFYQSAVRPVIEKLEESLERALLIGSDATKYQIKVNHKALLRGDTAAQTTQYVQLWQIGALTTDEIRGNEDLEPFNTPESSKPHYPYNATTESVQGAKQPTNPADGGIAPDGSVGTPHQEHSAPAAAVHRHGLPAKALRREESAVSDVQLRALSGRKDAAKAATGIFTEAFGKIARKERAVVGKMADSMLQRSESSFEDRLKELYEKGGDLRRFIVEALAAPSTALFKAIRKLIEADTGQTFSEADANKIIARYIEILGWQYSNESLYTLLRLMDAAKTTQEASDEINARLDHWAKERPDLDARNETARGQNVFATAFYKLAGIGAVRWVTQGGGCPICEPFANTVYKIDDSPDLPYHSTCNCSTVPVSDN